LKNIKYKTKGPSLGDSISKTMKKTTTMGQVEEEEENSDKDKYLIAHLQDQDAQGGDSGPILFQDENRPYVYFIRTKFYGVINMPTTPNDLRKT
jgi:hypothetical protein